MWPGKSTIGTGLGRGNRQFFKIMSGTFERGNLEAQHTLDEDRAAEIIRVLDGETQRALIAVDELHHGGMLQVQARLSINFEDFVAYR